MPWAILALLVDKSLVQADALAGDDRRYRMLQPAREYALARLVGSGELGRARDRHARHYPSRATGAAGSGRTPHRPPSARCRPRCSPIRRH